MHELIDLVSNNHGILDFLYQGYTKNAQPFMEYQRIETMVRRSHTNDRVHPLDTVTLQQFNREHNTSIEHAVIHSGPLADEYARAMNALAVTVGTNIYFRNSAWNPTDEEGRKLLAHELTHVAQFKDKRTKIQINKEYLEQEAEQAEQKEMHQSDPLVTIKAKGKQFTLRKSHIKSITHEVNQSIEEWIEIQRQYLGDEEYLELLLSYQNWLREAM